MSRHYQVTSWSLRTVQTSSDQHYLPLHSNKLLVDQSGLDQLLQHYIELLPQLRVGREYEAHRDGCEGEGVRVGVSAGPACRYC